MRQMPDDAHWIALARASVTATVRGGATPPPAPDSPPARGVFVTIERRGVVLGCRGTLTPRSATLDREIIAAACAAAAHDPRYKPLRPADLDDFQVTVTLIERLEPLTDLVTLRPGDGLVLTAGSRTGIVLPWEGRDPKTRLDWAYRKAGVVRGASVRLQRLIAPRYRG